MRLQGETHVIKQPDPKILHKSKLPLEDSKAFSRRIFFTCQLNKHLHNEMQLEMRQKYTKHKKICDKVAEVDSLNSSK